MVKGRPRKLSLSPMQREVLWILEEAGAEDITALVNTLAACFPEYSTRDMMTNAEEAIRGLHDIGLVAFSRDYEKPGLNYVVVPVEETPNLLSISKYINYNSEEGYWVWDETLDGEYRLTIVLTEEGKRALTR